MASPKTLPHQLKSIRLIDFKGFRDATIDFGRLTLIVGANASGKSNIRDALRLLHGVGLGYSLADILGEKYGAGGVLQWRGIRGGVREVTYNGASEFEVRCRFECPNARNTFEADPLLYRLRVNVEDENMGPRVVREGLERSPASFYWDSHPDEDWLDQRGEHQIVVGVAGNL